MGKYMKKTKITGEVSVMEVPHQSSLGLGVRTRARTLALQRAETTSSYLQLRSRRLHKPPVPKPTDHPPLPNPNPNPTPTHSPYPSPRSSHSKLGSVVGSVSAKASPENEAALEVSFGENVLELEARSRNARETTPCSLIRDSETVETPGSTTRPANATARRPQRSAVRDIPTAQEMEEFFAVAEKLQQKMFAEKYNFDPVSDRPLAGRYEWVKLDD